MFLLHGESETHENSGIAENWITTSMTSQNPWELLRSGNVTHGLDLMREGYRHDPSASHIMQLGIVVAGILTFVNAGIICRWMFTGKKSSVIPVIGGISGTLGLLAIPFEGFAK